MRHRLFLLPEQPARHRAGVPRPRARRHEHREPDRHLLVPPVCLYSSLFIRYERPLHAPEGPSVGWTIARRRRVRMGTEPERSLGQRRARSRHLDGVRWLRDVPIKDTLFWCSLVSAPLGLTQLALVYRLNLEWGIPDGWFTLGAPISPASADRPPQLWGSFYGRVTVLSGRIYPLAYSLTHTRR